MMRKTAIIVLLVILLGAGLLYAQGDLIVNGSLGVGPTFSPANLPQHPVDVQGDVNITGAYRINGVAQLQPTLMGAISGLRIANDATYPNTEIDVSANYIGTVVPSGTMVINCGSGQSGLAGGNDLDKGALQVSTWYYIWVIYNPATGGIAGLASVSSTSPALPSGFTQSRLVGVALTNSSAQFVVFVQQGNRFIYDTYQQVSTGSSAQNWTPQSCAPFIPPISTRGLLQLAAIGNGSNPADAALKKNGSSSTTGHYMGRVPSTSGAGGPTTNDCLDTDTGQTVQLSISAAVGAWYLRVLGFELNL
jgi:hypothetical protein